MSITNKYVWVDELMVKDECKGLMVSKKISQTDGPKDNYMDWSCVINCKKKHILLVSDLLFVLFGDYLLQPQDLQLYHSFGLLSVGLPKLY